MSGTGTGTGSWIFQADRAILVTDLRPLDGGVGVLTSYLVDLFFH